MRLLHSALPMGRHFAEHPWHGWAARWPHPWAWVARHSSANLPCSMPIARSTPVLGEPPLHTPVHKVPGLSGRPVRSPRLPLGMGWRHPGCG
eukprot:9152218-Alexandrium_andersonii.AAC.1